MSNRWPACVPTCQDRIYDTRGAISVIENCINGSLSHCFRKPYDGERNQLIVSGNVFVYEATTSGIKRWTDGITWHFSHQLGDLLIYQELEGNGLLKKTMTWTFGNIQHHLVAYDTESANIMAKHPRKTKN